MKKNILITGGYGFLGRAIALKFKQHGHCITGIGHGTWSKSDFQQHGFDHWFNLDVSMTNLLATKESFDVVIHCAGTSSVADSHAKPLHNFNKTVQSAAELLEYIRLYHPTALFIYPSSAAVYGAKEDRPIKEIDCLNPISPYGYHKRMIEELCDLYTKTFAIKTAIVRFFSIYGPGLQKQLLWDATSKLSTTSREITFWGTGEETRDWIYIEDAANLILKVSEQDSQFTVINGASGIKTTVKSIIEMLRDELNPEADILFNNIVREGDPRFYFADIDKTKQIGWSPTMLLPKGVSEYLAWFKKDHCHG